MGQKTEDQRLKTEDFGAGIWHGIAALVVAGSVSGSEVVGVAVRRYAPVMTVIVVAVA
jgi:hypothetical protein